MGRSTVWGSVGFRNGASDSKSDKRWVRNKFIKDLGSAKKQNPKLDHFVFFTNVDLTPNENLKLKSIAIAKGIVECDVYYRERMRMALDNTEGLALRYQYLGIEMSSAEQAAFFARFGDVLHDMVAKRFDDIDRKLARIEFHSECLRPTRYIGLSLQLKRPLSSEDIRDIRLLAIAVAESKPEPHPTLCLKVTAGTENIGMKGFTCFRSEVTIWAGPPLQQLLSGGQAETFPEQEQLLIGLHTQPVSGFSLIADFDRLWLHLYASKKAIEAIGRIDFVVNGYVLARSEMADLGFDPCKPDDEWLTHCYGQGQRDEMMENIDGPTAGTVLPPFVFTDFSGYLPIRIDDANGAQKSSHKKQV